jgi:hypothetical protein
MRLRQWLDEETKKEGYIPSHQACSRGSAETLCVEWRDGTRRAFPWARFSTATLDKTEIVLSFGEHEVVIRGLNLDHLWDHVCDRGLEQVWELPADYVPPPTLKSYRICVLKIDLREVQARNDFAPATSPQSNGKSVQMKIAGMRA